MTTTHRLPRAAPQSRGVDPAALDRLVETLDGLRDVHSLMVLRHGHVVAEAWWDPFTPDEPHRMFSVSKSVTATAVSIAVAEGLLTTSDKVVDLLPDDAPSDPGEHLAAMTVRDLLTMTSGHGTDTMNFTLENLHRPGNRWARDILAGPVPHEPGTRFVYNTGATYLLSAILHRLTGMRLLDWLTPRLFAPLGITGATWEQCPAGIDVGGYGLAITTEDLATLGQLWLQRGRWDGGQLVAADLVDEMTSFQVPNGPDGKPDWEQGYGYQFWRCRHGAYRADGAFGQFAVVSPAHDAVVVLTSGTAATDVELEAVLDMLDTGMSDGGASAPQPGSAGAGSPEDPTPVPDGAGAFAPDGLAVAVPRGSAHVPLADFVRGSSFRLTAEGADASTLDGDGPPMLRWHAISVDHGDAAITFAWTREHGGRVRTMRCGLGRWLTGPVEVEPGVEIDVAAAAAWTGPHELTLRWLWRGTPFAVDVVLSFGGDGEGRWVEVAVDQNVSFGPTALLRATGLGAGEPGR